MIANSTSSVRLRWGVCLLMVIVLLVTQFTMPLRPALALGPLTIGGLIALSKFALDQIESIAEDAIAAAGEEVRRTLDQLKGDLQDLINTLEQTYQDNLFLTIDQLDLLTQNKLVQIQGFIENLNEKIQADIRLISEETRNVITTAGLEISRITADLEQRLTNLVVVATEGVVFVLDKTVFNIILILSLVLLGVGVLIFIWLFFTRRLPEGGLRVVVLALMGLFIVAFGALAFVPPARAAVMDATGLGLEKRLDRVTEQRPEIVGVQPRKLVIGTTRSVSLFGVGLRPEGKTITAKIGPRDVPITASSEREVALNVAGLSLADGVFDVVLLIDGAEGPRGVVEIENPPPPARPADLTITGFSISPSSPTQGRSVTATITIRNDGETTARNFDVHWRPFAQSQPLRNGVTSLAPGASRPFSFTHTYAIAGTFDSIATVDPNGSVEEIREDNNSRTIRNVVVRPAPPRRARVTVRITRITIHDNSEPPHKGNGEVRFNINVGGRTGRFPASGTRSVANGAVLNVNQTFTVELTEGQNLAILITGVEEDDPGFPTFDDHDNMGIVDPSFTSGANWGSGSHNVRSRNPGNFTVSFTITVQDLN